MLQKYLKEDDKEYVIGSENWVEKNNDERIVDYEPLAHGEFIIQYKNDPGVDKKKEVAKSMFSHLVISVLSRSKRIVNRFILDLDGLSSNTVYYQDADGSYIHMDHYQKLEEAGYVGKT